MPKTLEALVESDLLKFAPVIGRSRQDRPVIFHLGSPYGDRWLKIAMSPAPGIRAQQYRMIWLLMADLVVPGFSATFFDGKADLIVCVGMTRSQSVAVSVSPDGDASPALFPVSRIPSELRHLVPSTAIVLTPEQQTDVQTWFGANGKYPVLSNVEGLGTVA